MPEHRSPFCAPGRRPQPQPAVLPLLARGAAAADAARDRPRSVRRPRPGPPTGPVPGPRAACCERRTIVRQGAQPVVLARGRAMGLTLSYGARLHSQYRDAKLAHPVFGNLPGPSYKPAVRRLPLQPREARTGQPHRPARPEPGHWPLEAHRQAQEEGQAEPEAVRPGSRRLAEVTLLNSDIAKLEAWLKQNEHLNSAPLTEGSTA